jgi:tetratricopeptide (TPR) repeat protein/GTP-binding protein EngB required for normal cell division
MGIIDRIAGTLDELAGDGDGAALEEIALAVAMADRGDLADAEARLADVSSRFPTLGPALFHLGRLRARRGALEEAVTALGKAVDLDGDVAAPWAALGEALARLGRAEPARDALRKALVLSTDAALRGRAHATLGGVYADAGQLGKAIRELRKAQELLGDDPEVGLAYGRVLARAGEPEGGEWLTRAARRAGAAPSLFAEAATATGDARVAEALLREGLARAPLEVVLRAALARQLARTGRAEEALGLALEGVAANPGSREALAALREAYVGARRWRDALAVVVRETELGAAPPAATRLALALAAQDRTALTVLADAPDARNASLPVGALRAWLAGGASDDELVALARHAPDQATRRFVAASQAPTPPPATNLAALLEWTHELAQRAPALVGLAVGAGRALEAFDRPLLVAVMGEFNAGKSSFVNALVGDEVAPTGVTPTTATVNVLRHGATSGARVIYHDGTARELGPASVGPFLRELSDSQAAAVRLVEIFHPLEALRRVEIVDTPGLNSIRPEHEKVARDFLVEADALVWVFAIGQAAKASEKEALALAHGQGKHVLGVLNKVDGATDEDIAAVVRHVQGGLGALVDEIVPFSATRALKARRADATDPALAALEEALERLFLGRARALKRATAVAALQRFVAAARSATGAPLPDEFPARRDALALADERLRGALASERVALRARLDEAYRSAAFEVRDFVRPRAWLFGEHRADAADERFLIELLEDAVERATDVTRAVLEAALADGVASATGPLPATARGAIGGAIETAIERFASYACGVIEGGAVAEFFRYDLPRIRLDATAIRAALTRRAPDPEQVLFGALARDLAAGRRGAETALDHDETDASIRRTLREEHLERPLAALARAIGELGQEIPAPSSS